MFIREVPMFLKDLRAFCSQYKYTWYRGVHLKSSIIKPNVLLNDDGRSEDDDDTVVIHAHLED